MAWTYYTANLAAGELFTKNQRNELYDAFLARVAAAGLYGIYTVPSHLTLTPLSCDLVLYTPAVGSPSYVRMLDVLPTLSTYFMRSDLVFPPGLTFAASYTDFEYVAGSVGAAKTVLKYAGDILGLSTSDLSGLIANPTIDARHRWNLIRTALQNMNCRRFVGVSASSDLKVGSWHGGSWPDARDDFLAAGFGTGPGSTAGIQTHYASTFSGTPPSGGPPYYYAEGERVTINQVLDTGGFYWNWALMGFRQTALTTGISGATVRRDFGAANDTSVHADTGANMELEYVVPSPLGSGIGSIAVDVKFVAYNDATQCDLFEPDATNHDRSGATTYVQLFANFYFDLP